jgi:hypothetical protein
MLHTLCFSLQNAVYFVMLPFLVPVLFTFYIQDVLKFKCKIRVPKVNMHSASVTKNRSLNSVGGNSSCIFRDLKNHRVKSLCHITTALKVLTDERNVQKFT